MMLKDHHETIPYTVLQLVRDGQDGVCQRVPAQMGAVQKDQVSVKPAEVPDQQSIALLRQLEHEVRRKKGLVSVDAQNCRLWLFGGDTAATGLLQNVTAAPSGPPINDILQYGTTTFRSRPTQLQGPLIMSLTTPATRNQVGRVSAVQAVAIGCPAAEGVYAHFSARGIGSVRAEFECVQAIERPGSRDQSLTQRHDSIDD